MSTIELAAGTAVVLAPIPAATIRNLTENLALPEPPPAPKPEPTPVLNYDDLGSYWGADTITNTEDLIARERAAGAAIDEWNVIARDGQPLRIARIADPAFLDTICVIPAAALPVDPAQLADLLLAPAADPNRLHQQLADQLTPRSARRLLAAAHHIAAERLWADAA